MKLLLALGLLAVLASGCTTEPQFQTPRQDDAGRYVIEMTSSLQFVPARAEVPAGSSVVFVSTGGVHNAVSETNAWQAPQPFGPGGGEQVVTLSEPGDYPYFCAPHKANHMEGVLRVVA